MAFLAQWYFRIITSIFKAAFMCIWSLKITFFPIKKWSCLSCYLIPLMLELVLSGSVHCSSEGALACNPRLHAPAVEVTRGGYRDQSYLLMPIRWEWTADSHSYGWATSSWIHSLEERTGVSARIRIIVKIKGILMAKQNSRAGTYSELEEFKRQIGNRRVYSFTMNKWASPHCELLK